MLWFPADVTCCGMCVREYAHNIIWGKPYLSHSLPVVESPVDRFVVLNSRWGHFLYVNTFCVAPDVYGGSCAVPDPVGGIAASGQRRHLVFLLRPATKHRQRKFDKSCADVQVQTLSGEDGELRSASVLVTGNLIWISKRNSTGGVGSLL
jgi:hypothetical protein